MTVGRRHSEMQRDPGTSRSVHVGEAAMAGEAARALGEGSPRLGLDDHLAHALRLTADAISRLTARAYEDRFNLSSAEWRLIAWLAECGPAREAEIARRAAMDSASVAHAAESLVKRGAAHARDERLALSAEGYALHVDITPLALAYEATLLTGFSPGEAAALKLMLARLRTAAERLLGAAA